MTALVDTHCHVAEPEFDADRDAVLARAAAAGVTTVVCVGATSTPDANQRALGLVGRHGDVTVVASVGIHPHDAAGADDAAFTTLEQQAQLPGVVAVGETGLDYWYDHAPREVQRTVFARTAALARAVDLPLVVHVRDAHGEAADILAAELAGHPGVIHCFTGTRDDARRYLDLGLHLSVSGIVTFRNADALREAVRSVPGDRLLVETDAPYLAPVPHRGRRNEPAHVRVVAEHVAAVRGDDPAALAGAVAANARRVFRLPPA